MKKMGKKLVDIVTLRRFAEKTEAFILKITPNFVKQLCNKIIDLLPEKIGNWIRNNRFFSICIIYTIRGLFFRPSMWLLYASIAAYFGYK